MYTCIKTPNTNKNQDVHMGGIVTIYLIYYPFNYNPK